MSPYRQAPSLTAAIAAVYVAGSLSSFLWDLAGAAVVGSGQYLDARPSAFLAIAWRIGGVVATSALAALVVKAILDLEGGSGVSYARSFAALLAGNMAGTLAFLALPYLGQEGAAGGSGGNLVLMAIVLHWLGFVLSIVILLGASPIAAEEGRDWGYKLPPGTRWRDDANLPIWIEGSEAEDDAPRGSV
jgi:hypothetical protein